MQAMRSNLASLHDPKLDALCAQLVHARVAPDVAAAYACWDGTSWQTRVGGSSAWFDLASLTKSFVSVACVRAGLPLDRRVADLLPALSKCFAAPLCLEQLLSHRGGLRAHAHLWLCGSRAEALRHAANLPQQGWDGEAAIYSDLGYILAGEMLAAHGGGSLAELVGQAVLKPLGAGVVPAEGLGEAPVAPTEFLPGRGGLLRGVVHDDNAWFLSGRGLSGHAGLFGRASDVLLFATTVADAQCGRGQWAGTLEPLLRARVGGAMRAGFDGKQGTESLAGQLCSDATYGHLGFTGTSYWVDPQAGIATVLLSNRVSPSSAHPERLRAWRPKAHDAMFAWAKTLTTTP